MKIYFDNIKGHIIEEISKANFCVYVAVAWIGEKFIIKELVNCLNRGVQVEIIINDDDRFHNYKSKFVEFENFGGKIFLYDTATSLMHNKFCVIDLCTSITGSFNWSFGATFHQENIIIESNNIEVAHTFAKQFVNLKQKSTLVSNLLNSNVEIAHKINVKTFTILNDDIHGEMLILTLIEGNRKGFLQLKFNHVIDPSVIPSEIHGFWRSKLDVITYGSTDDNFDFYEFVCLDPYYLKYVL